MNRLEDKNPDSELVECECGKWFPEADAQTDCMGDVILCPECAKELWKDTIKGN